MTLLSVSQLDRAALLIWAGGLQFALFGAGLLIPMAIWRRRPAARHLLAVIALVAALASPLTAACSLRWGFDWTPIPGWMRLAILSEGSIVAGDGTDSTALALPLQTGGAPSPA